MNRSTTLLRSLFGLIIIAAVVLHPNDSHAQSLVFSEHGTYWINDEFDPLMQTQPFSVADVVDNTGHASLIPRFGSPGSTVGYHWEDIKDWFSEFVGQSAEGTIWFSLSSKDYDSLQSEEIVLAVASGQRVCYLGLAPSGEMVWILPHVYLGDTGFALTGQDQETGEIFHFPGLDFTTPHAGADSLVESEGWDEVPEELLYRMLVD